MRIRLHDARLLVDLLSFVQGAGCIAYQVEPERSRCSGLHRGDAESAEITELLAGWSASDPDASPEILGPSG